jgi:hypothetical protein
MSFISGVEAVGKDIEKALKFVFVEIKDEVPAILKTLVQVYGPEVVSMAIASHSAGVQMYVDKEISVGAADVTALVQSTLVSKFGNSGLSNTAAQFIASGINHLVTIGKNEVDSLLAKGTAAAIAATGATPAA